MNLMSNAIKYYTPNGRIFFFHRGKVKWIFQNLDAMNLQIEDNGIGMSPEFRKSCLIRSMRADDHPDNQVRELKMGMAISRNIVNLMNGTIKVDNYLAKGN